jgi:hypothetical protein
MPQQEVDSNVCMSGEHHCAVQKEGFGEALVYWSPQLHDKNLPDNTDNQRAACGSAAGVSDRCQPFQHNTRLQQGHQVEALPWKLHNCC